MKWLCFALALLASVSFVSLASSEDIVSRATGLEGVRQLILDKELRFEIEVSPNQVSQLEELLNSEPVRLAVRKTNEQGFADHRAASLAIREADKVVIAKLNEVLEANQIRAMRVLYLQRKFSTAFDVLQSELMHEIGASEGDVQRASAKVKPQFEVFEKEYGELVTKNATKLMLSLPESSRGKLIQLFGNEVFREANSMGKPNVAFVSVFASDRGVPLLGALRYVILPKACELTEDQNAQLQQVRIVGWKKLSEGASAVNQFVDTELERILPKDQQVAIVQYLHSFLLRKDFLTLARPEILKALNLAPELESEFKAAVAKIAKETDLFRKANEREIFNLAVSQLPPAQQEILVPLFEGVW